MSETTTAGSPLSDIRPNELIGAIVNGTGLKSPRLMGMAMTGLSLAFVLINFVLVLALHRYFPYLYWLAGIFLFAGPFVLLSGEPRDRGEAVPVPSWARYGLIGCFVAGLVAGFALGALNWKAWLLGVGL